MTTSTILPPPAAKPAEIAAPHPQESTASVDTGGVEGGQSFGQVLKSQIDKSGQDKPASADAAPEEAEGLPADATAVAAELPIADLIGLLAAGQDARRQQPVDLASLAAKSTRVELPAQQVTASDLPRATAASTARSVAATRDQSSRDIAADQAADRAEGAAQFQVEEPTTSRRSGTLLRVRRDDFALSEKGAAAVALTEVPTSIVPSGGSAEAKRASDPSALRLTVAQPVGATGWDEAVADRVTWLGQARQSSAELHLNPPNLGPVEVHVSMQGDQTTVSFFSPHAPVREALQAAAPKLSEAFAAAGLSLGNVSVGADSNSRQDGSRQDQGRSRRTSDEDSAIAAVAAPGRWTSSLGGMRAVDLFA
jgi:flagellar hook-length control protein FliK